MSQSKSKNRLGRGIGGLLSDPAATSTSKSKVSIKLPAATSKKGEENKSTKNDLPVDLEKTLAKDFIEIDVAKVCPNPHQPRRHFDDIQLQELADSIQSEGLLQPIVVRAVDKGYELIAGERRLRAFQLLKLKKIPARLMTANDSSSAVIALIENLQREGLNSIDESLGYASLMRDFGLTQEAVAERLGKPRASIANSLRLLQLDKEIQGYIIKNLLSAGHAKVLLGLEDEMQRVILARRIVENALSVRETERLVRQAKSLKNTTVSAASSVNSPSNPVDQVFIKDLERQIASKLNTKVHLKHTSKKGRLIIEYFGNEDLNRILSKIHLI